MKMIGHKKFVLLAFCIIVFSSLLVILLPLKPAPETTSDLTSAVMNAIDFCGGLNESDALLMLDVIYRRFEIASFADALQRYDMVISETPDDAPIMRVFRRIADYDNVLQHDDLYSISWELDVLTVPALYCDRLELPADYSESLLLASRGGGYSLTHALLAHIWIQENGCELPLSEEFVEYLYHANAELINENSVVDDLELEAATFLYLAGQGDLVGDDFIESVLEVQKDDGGWLFSSDEPGDSDWHASVLALLLLLHLEYPADSYPPMLAPKP
jgi:hypothetical protein